MKTAIQSGFSIKKYLKGYLIAFLITIIVISVISVVLTYVDVSDRIIEKAEQAAKYFSAMLAGFLCARGGRKRGYLTGGTAALIYMTLLCAAGLCIFGNKSANPYIIKQLVTGTLCGALGGIMGINCKK